MRKSGRVPNDLLNDLDLTDRVLLNTMRYKEIIHDSINWQDVKEKLSSLKKASLEFLKNSLKK